MVEEISLFDIHRLNIEDILQDRRVMRVEYYYRSKFFYIYDYTNSIVKSVSVSDNFAEAEVIDSILDTDKWRSDPPDKYSNYRQYCKLD